MPRDLFPDFLLQTILVNPTKVRRLAKEQNSLSQFLIRKVDFLKKLFAQTIVR